MGRSPRRCVLLDSVATRLADLAARARPQECCGFLAGGIGPGGTIVQEVLPVRNDSALPDSFAICDAECYRAKHEARQHSLELFAVYHSHPRHSAALSATDQQRLRWTGLDWVLVGREDEGWAIAVYAAQTARRVTIMRTPR